MLKLVLSKLGKVLSKSYQTKKATNGKEILKNFYMKGGFAFATNGHVLYKVAVGTQLENGLYNVEGEKVEAGNYPIQTMEKILENQKTETEVKVISKELLSVVKALKGKQVTIKIDPNGLQVTDEILNGDYYTVSYEKGFGYPTTFTVNKKYLIDILMLSKEFYINMENEKFSAINFHAEGLHLLLLQVYVYGDQATFENEIEYEAPAKKVKEVKEEKEMNGYKKISVAKGKEALKELNEMEMVYIGEDISLLEKAEEVEGMKRTVKEVKSNQIKFEEGSKLFTSGTVFYINEAGDKVLVYSKEMNVYMLYKVITEAPAEVSAEAVSGDQESDTMKAYRKYVKDQIAKREADTLEAVAEAIASDQDMKKAIVRKKLVSIADNSSVSAYQGLIISADKLEKYALRERISRLSKKYSIDLIMQVIFETLKDQDTTTLEDLCNEIQYRNIFKIEELENDFPFVSKEKKIKALKLFYSNLKSHCRILESKIENTEKEKANILDQEGKTENYYKKNDFINELKDTLQETSETIGSIEKMLSSIDQDIYQILKAMEEKLLSDDLKNDYTLPAEVYKNNDNIALMVYQLSKKLDIDQDEALYKVYDIYQGGLND